MKRVKISDSKMLIRYKRALAQSRDNYAALFRHCRTLEQRNKNQMILIYRLRKMGREIAGIP